MARTIKRLACMAMCLMLALLEGCADQAPPSADEPAAVAKPLVYAIIVKDTTNPYMMRMYEGFAAACEEVGATALLRGPGQDGAPQQSAIVYELIEEGVDAIAIAANDREALSTALREARAAGIAVVSLDAAVNPSDRELHIQQVSERVIGRVLVQAGAEIMGRQGQFAILSTTPNMPNQESWVSWMRRELNDYKEKYSGMELVAVVYGQDQAKQSAEATAKLLADYPELKLIISPTVVGMRAAAEEITRAGSGVKLTGLGLPSNMEPYIVSGVCPWMYLWNPSDLGYLATYALNALTTKSIKGEEGDLIRAGKLGDRAVTQAQDGGTEVVLGNPKMFNSTNIMVWREAL